MNNIFVKKEKKINNITKKTFPKDELMASIPNNAKSEPDQELEKSHIEIRWRIFKFPNIQNEIIEMSQKIPNQERLYMNKNGKWVNFNDDGKYDQFITEKYYHYQETNN
jgi:hypothetical protein